MEIFQNASNTEENQSQQGDFGTNKKIIYFTEKEFKAIVQRRLTNVNSFLFTKTNLFLDLFKWRSI